MSEPSIVRLLLPVELERELASISLTEPALAASEVALCLSARVCDDAAWVHDARLAARARRSVGYAAASIRQAALQVELDLPVVVVLDLGMDAQGPAYEAARTTLGNWAADQEWHRGDFALYLCPPVAPEHLSIWEGPKTRDDLVQHLLGRGNTDWDLQPVERPRPIALAKQLKRAVEERGLDDRHPVGDLLLTAAGAIRRLEPGSEHPGDALVAVDAIGAWFQRHVAAAPPRADQAEVE